MEISNGSIEMIMREIECGTLELLRKRYRKAGRSRLGFDINLTAVGIDNVIADGQPKAGPLGSFFRCKEGLQDFFFEVFRNTGAIILNIYRNLFAFFNGSNR